MSILDTIKALFCSKSETQADSEVTSAPAPKPTPAPVSEPEKTVEVAKPVAAAPVTKVAKPSADSQLNIPEDATLRRHFIAKLKADVEAGMPARPTESTLKRHYDSTVQAAVDSLLGE